MYPVCDNLCKYSCTYRFVEGKKISILDLKKKKINKEFEEEKLQFYGNAQILRLGRSAGAE